MADYDYCDYCGAGFREDSAFGPADCNCPESKDKNLVRKIEIPKIVALIRHSSFEIEKLLKHLEKLNE